MNILVVEYNPDSRKKMELIVSELGNYNIVDSGSAALDAFDNAWKDGFTFDVIFLDLSTPDMDGIDVLKNIRFLEKVRKLSKDAQAKILMMASNSDRETVVACLESGCDNYIIKPVDKELVTDKLKHLGFQIGTWS